MTTDKDKKLYASLFMMLLLISPYSVLSDNTFCTKTWLNVYINDYIAGARASNGSYYAWGVNQFGGLGTGTNIFQTVPGLVGNASSSWTQIAMSLYHTLGLLANGSVYAWGDNIRGNLGPAIALGARQYTPARINVLGACKYIATHGLQYTSYAIKNAGTLWGFGDNTFRQLGAAAPAMSATPLQIGTASNWASVFPAKRDSHVCGLRTNGSLYCWGENGQGQVGDGTTTNRAAPFRIGSASDVWKAVFPVLYGTIAWHNNNTLYGWGTTWYGLFASGSDYASFHTPVQIAGGQTFKSVAVHDEYVVAVGTNGRLYGWGRNLYTQVNSNAGVGIQNTVNQISGNTNWDKAFVSVGVQMNAIGSAFAIRTNGNLFAWGSNDVGQLGLGPAAPAVVSTPTLVTGVGGDVSTVVSVGYVSGLINTNGDIYMTGFNNFNLLGDGTILSANDFFSCQNRSKSCVANACV